MVKQFRLPTAFVPLILGLCLVSLVCMILMPIVIPSMIDLSASDSAHSHPFSQVDLDQEFLFLAVVGAAVMDLMFSKMRTMSLNFRTLPPSPQFPPPK